MEYLELTPGQRLRLFRTSLDFNQSDLGNKIGIKAGTISTYEKLNRAIPDYVKISLHHQFNLNISWLETGQGQMFTNNNTNTEINQTIADGLDYIEKAKNKFEEVQKLLKNK